MVYVDDTLHANKSDCLNGLRVNNHLIFTLKKTVGVECNNHQKNINSLN